MTSRTRIGIAVVERDGCYLVGVRPEGKPLAGYAEFPGGKCESGEPPESCAVRECLEETGVAVSPVRLLAALPWQYPHGDVELYFWLCRAVEAGVEPREPFRWVGHGELARLRFPEANAGVVAGLIGGTESR